MNEDWIPDQYKGKFFLDVNDLKEILGVGINAAYDFAKSGVVRTEMISHKLRVNAMDFWNWYRGDKDDR